MPERETLRLKAEGWVRVVIYAGARELAGAAADVYGEASLRRLNTDHGTVLVALNWGSCCGNVLPSRGSRNSAATSVWRVTPQLAGLTRHRGPEARSRAYVG